MQSLSQAMRLLRQQASPGLRLSESLVCKRCVHREAAPSYNASYKSLRQTPFLKAFRSPKPAKSIRYNSTTIGLAAARNISAESRVPAAKRVFPQTSDKKVAYWLLGSAASVFGIVIFGGLTRLTESGLSITEWKPVTGSMPPTTPEAWEAEFALYRSSPEFKQLNSRMTLEEFQQIYFMEWAHRLWGRFVGMTFLIPTVYFIARRQVSAGMALKLTGICGLIGFQGVIGWWMVKSGLKDDLFAPGSHPRVSQYRLTAHLGAAFVLYMTMVWNGLSILREHRLLKDPEQAQKLFGTMKHPDLRFFRRSVGALCVLIFTTAMSGALVAGLDAGLIYNEFPYMGLGLTPPKKELFDTFYSHVPDHSDLWWRNMLENPSLVQLDHRILAMTTFTSVLALFAYTRLNPRVKALITRDARKGVLGLVHLVTLQAALGISTLIYLVPTPLASAHQAGALALLTGAIVLAGRVWLPRRAARLVAQKLATAPRPSAAVPSPVARRGPDAMLSARTGIPTTSPA